MKKVACFHILILTAYFNLNAQVPGYVGKRLAVLAEFGISPAFNEKYKTLDYLHRSTINDYGINFRPGIGLDYTMGKVVTIGITYKHLSTHLPMSYYSAPITGGNDDDADYKAYFGDIDISSNYGSIYVKLYPFQRKGSIAPIGKYHKIEIVYGSATAKTGAYKEFDYYNDGYSNVSIPYNVLPLADFQELNYEHSDPLIYLIYAFGSETIIFEKIILDYNMQVGLPLSSNFFHGRSTVQSYGTTESEFSEDVAARISNTFFLGFSVSFGYFIK